MLGKDSQKRRLVGRDLNTNEYTAMWGLRKKALGRESNMCKGPEAGNELGMCKKQKECHVAGSE